MYPTPSSSDRTDYTATPARSPDLAQPGWERATLEKLAFAAIDEQRAARRWKYGWRIVWLALLAFIVWSVFTQRNAASTPSGPHTAMVAIEGEIADGADASAERIVNALTDALKDSGSKAVVLAINSPGGSPVQAGIVFDEILRLKAEYKKPVYAVVGESCASGAYYIAAAADQIYVDKASIVGSIGVLVDSFGVTGLMEKIGVERRMQTAGVNKGFLDPFSPQTEAQKAHVQNMLDQIHQQFIAAVKKGRGKRLKETPDTFSGLFWTGQQAVDMGLADGLGHLNQVARDVVKAEEIVDYTQRGNVAERLAKRFGAAVGEGSVRALRSAPLLR